MPEIQVGDAAADLRAPRLGLARGFMLAVRTVVASSRSVDAPEYHKLAAVEDRMWYFRALHAEVERRLVKELAGRPAAILDAGCGTGGLIRRLASHHPRWNWTGLDVSDLALSLARTRVSPSVSLVRGSVTALPFPDETFDVVVSADVLYHVADDRTALREAHRVLKPGGIVVVNVPAYDWLWSYHDVTVHSHRRYTRAKLVAKAQDAGFANVFATYRNAVTLPVVALRRKLLPPPRGGSDVQLLAPAAEWSLNAVTAIERGWLRAFGRLPFGSSVFCVARRVR